MKEMMSRRDFLITAGVLGLSIAAGVSCRDDSPEQLFPLTLEQEIEEKHSVNLISISEFKDQNKLPRYMISGISPDRWDDERILMIDRQLDLLPSHLFEPNRKGQRMQISLGEESAQINDRLITLEHTNQYIPTDSHKSFLVLVHELTHVISCTRGGAENCFESTAENNSYYKDINEALGMRYESINESVYEQLINSYRNFNIEYSNLGLNWGELQYSTKVPLTDRQQAQFYEIMLKGVSWENPTHFITSLAEHYVHGKDYFDMYLEFFSPEQTKRLYQFTKEKIFNDIEYDFDWNTQTFTQIDGS